MPDVVIHKLVDWGNREIYILREDLLPLACGGNKVRIALELIADAKDKGATALVGYGNSRSNLCRVLAMLCAKEGLRCVIVSPSDVDGHRVDTTNSSIVRRSGAEVVECPCNGNVAEVVRSVMKRLRFEGEEPYYIFGNELGRGNENILKKAYVGVAEAILEWEQKNGMSFSQVVVAVGTGSTYAGLLEGFRKCGNERHVVGYTVAREYVRCCAALNSYTSFPIDIRDNALNGGYAKTSPEELLFLADMMRRSSIMFDPVYSGKALWGLHKDASREVGRTLFVHTGSLPLALDAFRCASSQVVIRRIVDLGQIDCAVAHSLCGQMPRFNMAQDELMTYLNKMATLGELHGAFLGTELKGLLGFYANNHETRMAYLSMIVVDSSVKGTGVGSELWSVLIRRAQEAGMRNLECNVVKGNERAISFYKKRGLEIAGSGQDQFHQLMRGSLSGNI